MYVLMLMLGFNIYSPAGFVNVSSGIGTDLSLISYILLPVRTLNVVLSPPINILSLVLVHLMASGATESIMLKS